MRVGYVVFSACFFALSFCVREPDEGTDNGDLIGNWVSVRKSGEAPVGCENYTYEVTYRRYVLSDSGYSFYTTVHTHRIGRTPIVSAGEERCATSRAPIEAKLLGGDSGQWLESGNSIQFRSWDGTEKKYAFVLKREAGKAVLSLDGEIFTQEKTPP